MDPLLDPLTDPQRAAVTHVEGPLLILAGPGSGKTRVVAHRVAYLLREGVTPSHVAAVTFTNKAAAEMRARVDRLAPGKPVWIGTFHKFCAKLLREFAPLVGLEENFSIYDTADSLSVLKRSLDDVERDFTHYTPQQIAAAISWAKNNLISAERYQRQSGSPLGAIVAEVYPRYQESLLRANAVDFDDMLLHVAQLLRENAELRRSLDARFRYLLVDEYQDTNLAQYAIARGLSIDQPNLAVTGDPDQSIYAWRGANLRNILDFERDFPDVKVVRLEQNYRSTPAILSVAQHLISHNLKRKPKGLFTLNPPGPPVRLRSFATHHLEAQHVAEHVARSVRDGRRQPRDFAVFMRTNALTRTFEHKLTEAGVPYQVVNGVEFYQRKEIKDALSYLTLLNNPRDDEAFLRVVNSPPRGIGKKTVDRLLEHAAGNGLSLLAAARQAGVVPSISGKTAVLVAQFVSLYDRLSLAAAEPVAQVLSLVLQESGYAASFAQSSAEEDQERLANLQELVTAAHEFDLEHPSDGGIEAFLEQSCLVSDVDAWEADDNRVALMTLHASKGLEFPVVAIIGIEDGVLPHERSKKDPEQLEEERRLLFVGMTRAREELLLTFARFRQFRGREGSTVPSSFFRELPREEIEGFDEAFALQPSSSVQGEWDQSNPATEEPVIGADELAENGESDASGDDESLRFDPADWEGSASGQDVDVEAESSAPTIAVGLRTAADLLRGAVAGEETPVWAFRQGLAVIHPEYGAGVIVSLDGKGAKRMATVQFPSVGRRRFVLASSRLRPAQG